MKTSAWQLESSHCPLLGAAEYGLGFVQAWLATVTQSTPLVFKRQVKLSRIFSKKKNLLNEELFRHFLIKQTLRTKFQDQEITDTVQTSCSTCSTKKSTKCSLFAQAHPPVMTLQPGSSCVWLWKPQLGYRVVQTETHQIQIPQVKSRVLGTLFPLPIIYCCRVISRGSSAGNHTSDRERPTGCSQRENSTLLSFSLFCQFIKAWALRPKRKIPNSLLLRMHSLFAIHVYVAGVQSSKKTPENTFTFFF